MTAQPSSGNAPGTQQVGQVWEAGYKALFEGWRQAQEFWSSAARSWGEVASAWMGQFGRPGQPGPPESAAVVRELQDAAFAVGQEWMRLPLVLATGRVPHELQDAVTRLTQAQGRAYQLWLEAFTRSGASVAGAASEAAKTTGAAASEAVRSTAGAVSEAAKTTAGAASETAARASSQRHSS